MKSSNSKRVRYVLKYGISGLFECTSWAQACRCIGLLCKEGYSVIVVKK